MNRYETYHEREGLLTNGGGSPNTAPSRRRGRCRRASLEALMHPVKTEILLVRTRAAALSLLLVQVECLVLDEADTEQAEVRP